MYPVAKVWAAVRGRGRPSWSDRLDYGGVEAVGDSVANVVAAAVVVAGGCPLDAALRA